MSRLLVLGVGPLPFENRKKVYGLSLRTWHFLKPLLDAGHEICLVAMQLPDPYKEEKIPQILQIERDNLLYFSVDELYVFMDINYLQMHHDVFQPDAIIGVNTHAAQQACRLKTDCPIWADLNGWVMAEAQAKAALYKDDHFIDYFWKQEAPIVHRADRFSTVSAPQKFALIGELAVGGRLTKETFGYEFVEVIPNSVENKDYRPTKTVLRGVKVEQDDFVILWSGGYNTWTDVETLFKALTQAMSQNLKIKFVSTGGKIDGHDDMTYPRFLKMIENSPYKDRFLMLGWVPTEDIENYHFESNLGINIDAMNYEVLFGARNRLTHMMKTGLPVLTTVGTEVTQTIQKEKLGLTFQVGNVENLAQQIIWSALHRDEINQIGQRGKQYVLNHWTIEKTTEAVQAWAKNPTHAPDWKSPQPIQLNSLFSEGG